MVLSALVSFGLATYALIPQWREHVPMGQWLAALTPSGVAEFAGLAPRTHGASGTNAAGTDATGINATGRKVSSDTDAFKGAASVQVARSSQAAVQTRFGGCPQFFVQGRMPVVPAAPLLRELCFSSFAILHSGNTKTPVFVAQRLNRKMLTQAQSVSRADRFYEEARLPERERARLDDYRGSGWSRGHMAPAADMDSAESMAQSFSLANMVPQDQTHNAGAWSRIEQDTRKYVMRAKGDVFVFTGPVYGIVQRSGKSDTRETQNTQKTHESQNTRTATVKHFQTIGLGRVAIPDAIYKLVYDPATGRSWVHWQDNSANSRAGRPISYEEFVARTGLHLLPEVSVQAGAAVSTQR